MKAGVCASILVRKWSPPSATGQKELWPAEWRGHTSADGLSLVLSHGTEGNFQFTEIPGIWEFSVTSLRENITEKTAHLMLSSDSQWGL